MELELWQAVLVYGGLLFCIIIAIILAIMSAVSGNPDQETPIKPEVRKQHISSTNSNRKNNISRY